MDLTVGPHCDDALTVACEDCSLFRLAQPVADGGDPDWQLLDRVVKRRRALRRGERLFQPGDPFLSIYAVKSGSLKTFVPRQGGGEQITGFHLPGELLGLDAIVGEVHPCGAQALEPTVLCEVPLNRLEGPGRRIGPVQRQLLRVLSGQLLHDQRLQTVLCRQAADDRLAAFLLNLWERLRQRGFTGDPVRLSMTRNEIANYLGLATETVSRRLLRLQAEGLIEIQRKRVRLPDVARLAERVGEARQAAVFAGPGGRC